MNKKMNKSVNIMSSFCVLTALIGLLLVMNKNIFANSSRETNTALSAEEYLSAFGAEIPATQETINSEGTVNFEDQRFENTTEGDVAYYGIASSMNETKRSKNATFQDVIDKIMEFKVNGNDDESEEPIILPQVESSEILQGVYDFENVKMDRNYGELGLVVRPQFGIQRQTYNDYVNPMVGNTVLTPPPSSAVAPPGMVRGVSVNTYNASVSPEYNMAVPVQPQQPLQTQVLEQVQLNQQQKLNSTIQFQQEMQRQIQQKQQQQQQEQLVIQQQLERQN